MWFDVAKDSHLSRGSIHPCTHIQGLGRELDFIDTDHVGSALSNSAKAGISDACHFTWIALLA